MRVLSWIMSLTMSASGTVQPIGVGPVEYSGEIPEYFQRDIERTLGEAIEQAHGVAVELRVESCTQLECLQGPAAEAQLAVLLMPRVTKENRDYRVELVAYSVDDATMLARVEAECSVCGQQELLDSIPAKVVELHAKLAATLAAAPPVNEPVSDELPPRPSNGAGRGLRAGGWLSVALGLAGTGTGVALLVLDGRGHGPTCSPDLVDDNGACPNVYTTATAGAVSLGLGLAVLGVGAGLLIHDRRRASKDARVRLTAAGIHVSF